MILLHEGKIEPLDEQTEEQPERPEYVVQTMFGIFGGIILLAVNAVGGTGGLREVLRLLIREGYLAKEIGEKILQGLNILVLGGGLTVFFGSLLLQTKLRFIGIRLILIGAGISFVQLILRIVEYGPRIQNQFVLAYENVAHISRAFTLLGFGVGFLGLGVLLAFLATFKRLKWPFIIAGISFLAMVSGLVADLRLFRLLFNFINLTGRYVNFFLGLIQIYGILLLIVALLYGLGWKLIAKILLFIGILLGISSIALIFLTLPSVVATSGLTGARALISYLRILGMLGMIGMSVYVIVKGK